MASVELLVPAKFQPLWRPARNKAFWGGRGSAKSHSVGEYLIVKAAQIKRRTLCCREIQKSIAASVKQLLDDKIGKFAFTTRSGRPFFTSTETEIRGENGSWFGFAGLRTNPDVVKSMEGLDAAWVEEASRVSARSLELLGPTLRAEGSERIYTWNPEFADDPVDAMFRGPLGPPPDSVVIEVNWRDNPFFPDVLRRDMEWDRRRDPDKYAHIWGGGYRKNSEARVFRNWRVEETPLPPPGTQLLFGADWGFATDPSVLVRSWIDQRTLYVDYSAWGVGVEIDHLPALFAGSDVMEPPRWRNPLPHIYTGIPGALRWQIRADSARPDTISYMRNRGFNIVGAAKGPGSIEDGVEFLQSMDIVVHPRCTHVIDELSLFSYKVDRQTEAVLPILEDKKNHTIDSLRYSHEGSRRGITTTRAVLGMH